MKFLDWISLQITYRNFGDSTWTYIFFGVVSVGILAFVLS